MISAIFLYLSGMLIPSTGMRPFSIQLATAWSPVALCFVLHNFARMNAIVQVSLARSP